MFKFLKKLFAKNYEDLSGSEFKSRYQSGKKAMLIDVRTPAEFNAGTIKSAKNINVTGTDFNSQINKLAKDTEYFVFCRSGARSGHACRVMSANGLKAVNLIGGIGAWPK